MERVKGRRAFSVGSVIGRTFAVWTRNIVPFTLLAVIVQSPLLIYTALLLQGGLTAEELKTWNIVTNWGPQILNPIVAGLIAYGVFQQLNGKSVGVAECLQKGLGQILPVLATGIVVAVIVAIGTLLFVIPGIIFSCMLWVAVPVAVVERTGVFTAMRRSNTLTRGEKGSVFVILLVLGLISLGVAMVVGVAFAGAQDSASFVWAIIVMGVILSVLQSVAAAVGYHDLRLSKEGVAVEELVAVFA